MHSITSFGTSDVFFFCVCVLVFGVLLHIHKDETHKCERADVSMRECAVVARGKVLKMKKKAKCILSG